MTQTPLIQITPLPSIFNQPSKLTPLECVQQVEAASKTVQDKIDQNDLTALLKWVTEGHLEEVEKLLKKNPSLGLGTGTIMDLSGRAFNKITALQYAAWALDAEMTELIIKYLGAHHSAIQMKALAESPQTYSNHGVSYDMISLVNKYQTYLDNYSKWDDYKRPQYWQKEIGREQRNCPAWLIYAWSEEGVDVAWTKQDPHRKITREYDKRRLEWWFTESYNNGRGVGSSWGIARGRNSYIERYFTPALSVDALCADDKKCVLTFGTARRATLQQLRAEVEAKSAAASTAPTLY